MRSLKILWRLIVLGCCAVVIAMTLLLWSATGRAGYTRYHDAERAERDAQAAQGSIADLFADTGIEALPEVENRFMLGLAPSGPGKHSVSVITIAGPAMLVGLGSLASLILLLRKSSGSGAGFQPAIRPQ